MHIRPTGETELVTTGSGSSSSSNESCDMSLESSTDDSNSLSADEASMKITAAYNESGYIYENNFQQSAMADDSAMDMTVALGGVLDKTAMLPSGQEELDEDSESEQESDDAEHEDRDDMTVTMQFTSVYGVDNNTAGMDTTQEKVEEEEDDEFDMQLTYLNDSIVEDGTPRMEVQEQDGDSAMDMTEIYNQSPATVKSRRSSTASNQRRISRVPSPERSTPRIGHEYCKIPHADSPKHKLSTAFLKAQARRQSQSPVKPATFPSKSKLGESHTSSTVTPFCSVTSHQEPVHTRRSLPASPSPSLASPLPARKSSPARNVSTPSKVWKSFRLSQGSTSTSPAKRLSLEPSSPSRSNFGSPQRIIVRSSPRYEMGSPREMRQEKPQEVVQGEDRTTMKQFFDSLDMGFLELSMPSKKKVYQDTHVEVEVQELDTADIIKAACAHVPSLNSLIGACEELKSTVDEGHAMALGNEEAFILEPPLYVSEMATMSSQAGKQRAISAFRLQKSAARAIAQKAYYTWRADRQFNDEDLLKWKTVESKLRNDAKYIKEASNTVRGQSLPVLKRRHEELLEQVERERKRQRDIAKCDDEEINMLLESIEDQEQAWIDQQNSHQKAQAKAKELQDQISRVVEERKSAEDALNNAKDSYESIAVCTREESNRLARQIKQFESLYMWKLCKVNLNKIVLELEQTVTLTLQMSAFSVSGAQITVSRGGNIWQVALQRVLEERLALKKEKMQPAEVVRFITTAWARIRHFTSIFEALQARFPAEIETRKVEENQRGSVVARASVLFPRQKSKVIVEASCDMARLLDCKANLFEPDDISASCVYGIVDAPAIAVQIADCVTMGASAGNLTMAILEAVETFD